MRGGNNKNTLTLVINLLEYRVVLGEFIIVRLNEEILTRLKERQSHNLV